MSTRCFGLERVAFLDGNRCGSSAWVVNDIVDITDNAPFEPKSFPETSAKVPPHSDLPLQPRSTPEVLRQKMTSVL